MRQICCEAKRSSLWQSSLDVKFLTDENIPRDLVASLRIAGHDVLSIQEEAPGSSDREVLDRASSQGRILIKFDKDFGELSFRFGLPTTSGIILLRFGPSTPQHVVDLTMRAIGPNLNNIIPE